MGCNGASGWAWEDVQRMWGAGRALRWETCGEGKGWKLLKGKEGCSQGPSPNISVSATSGLLPPPGLSTLLPAALIPGPCWQCNPAPASRAPLGFGSAAPAACHPPACLPPSALAVAARLLPRSTDLHHPEICRSRSRACPWHWQQHPSSLLLCLRAAASTAQPSAVSPGAGVPTRWRQWHPSLLLPLHPCHPSGMPRPTGWHRDASCTLRHPARPDPCAYCHLPTPTRTSPPTQPVFLTCITHFQLFAGPKPVFCQLSASWHSFCSFPHRLSCPCRGDALGSH